MEIFIILLVVIEVILLIIALRDLVKRKFKNLVFALVWLLIILAVPVVGPVMYLFLKDGMSAGRIRTFNPQFHQASKKGE